MNQALIGQLKFQETILPTGEHNEPYQVNLSTNSWYPFLADYSFKPEDGAWPYSWTISSGLTLFFESSSAETRRSTSSDHRTSSLM